MSKFRKRASASLAAVALATPAAAEVASVTLSSGGLAEIVTRHDVSGDAAVRFEVPAEQLDDVLKSVVVRDPAGRVVGLSLDGPQQAEETLRRMPFKAQDVASPDRLANALQGVTIRVESDGKTVEGASLGVSERAGGRDEGTVRMLSVMRKDGAIDTVRLVEGASLKILDEGLAAKLREAAGALGAVKADGARVVEISLKGDGDRKVAVSYVVPAPVWKTAYRIVMGDGGSARLQAWAIIENATGVDWTGAAVTIQTGAPVTLRQRLFQRYWRDRPEVPVETEATFVPEVDRGAMAPRAAAAPAARAMRRFSGDAAAEMAAEPRADMSAGEMAAPAAQAAAEESAVSASYRLPSPVTLAAGRTLSVPIVDAEVPGERISLYRRGQGQHPIAAISLKNATSATLPPGILTVYDAEAGYVGDARLPATPAGEERLASFATDRKVIVRSEEKPEETVAGVKVVDGVARVSVVSRSVTDYSIKGAPDGERTVVVEHPRRPGWTFSSPALASETATAYRLKAKLGAGQSTDLRATLETTRLDTFQLADADEAQLLDWAASPADPKTSDRLKAVAKLRGEAAAVEREIADIDDKAGRLRTEQERIRANMGATPRESDFGKKLLRQLETSEGQIGAAGGRREKAAERLDTIETELRTAIAGF